MRNISNKSRKVRALTLALTVFGAASFVSAPEPANAFVVYCTNCSTVFSQVMQYAQQVETAANTAQQLETQIQQYQNMLLQGMSLPTSAFQQLTNNFSQIQSLYNQSSALAGNLSNFDSNFQSRFPGYSSYLNSIGTNPGTVQNYYQQWSQNGLDANKTAMAVAGDNVNQIPAEDQTLAGLVNQSQSAQGRLQAIQAGNQIAAQQVQQMQKLREMMNAQIQNESMYYAQNIQRHALDDAETAQFYSGTVDNSGPTVGY